MTLVAGLLVFLLSAGAAWAATGALISLMGQRGILDVPNERSSHETPRPRGGGLGILVGILVGSAGGWAFGIEPPTLVFWMGAGLMALAGFLGDWSGGVSVLGRLLIQVVAAGLVVRWAGGLSRLPLPAPLDVPLGPFGIPLAVVWIVGVTNLYNFLDGIDGYAGLQGVVAGLGMAALLVVHPPLAFGLVLAGACLGFLAHNWHPARIFMGDAGAYLLGFMLAALPFEIGPAERPRLVFATTLCLWFFLSDGTFTILRRLVGGEKIWTAHRSHLYQRLVRAGMSHGAVALRVSAAATVVAALGILVVYHRSTPGAWVVLMGAAAAFWLYYKITTSREMQGTDTRLDHRQHPL